MAKILLVEDDQFTASMVRKWLERERHTVEEAHTGRDAIDLLRVCEYELLILDWMLPEGSGIDVMKAYRDSGGRSPVLMLTGQKSTEMKEIGLDSGADDYLTKPFDPRELSARVRALLRRSPELVGTVLRCGSIALDTAKGLVTRDGVDIKLARTEYALLEFLMRHQGSIFSASVLLEHVWKSDSEATEVSVRTYVARLRRKIDGDSAQSLIANVHGLGYRFEAASNKQSLND